MIIRQPTLNTIGFQIQKLPVHTFLVLLIEEELVSLIHLFCVCLRSNTHYRIRLLSNVVGGDCYMYIISCEGEGGVTCSS